MKKIIMGMALVIVGWTILSWILMWPPICWPERITWSSAACINNLRMIDSGKEQWAIANHKTNGDSIVTAEVNQYLKGVTTPTCPDGGVYVYGRIGELPFCELDGQMIPARQRKSEHRCSHGECRSTTLEPIAMSGDSQFNREGRTPPRRDANAPT
jgi:hypothetical protein